MPNDSLHVAEVTARGIKCDAEGCDFVDMTAEFGDGKAWLKVSCPKCGAPLLTKADYYMVRCFQVVVGVLNFIFRRKPDSTLTRYKITGDGSGAPKITKADPPSSSL